MMGTVIIWFMTCGTGLSSLFIAGNYTIRIIRTRREAAKSAVEQAHQHKLDLLHLEQMRANDERQQQMAELRQREELKVLVKQAERVMKEENPRFLFRLSDVRERVQRQLLG